MDRSHADEAVRAGDVDELLRIVDGACAGREWDELERLRARCAAASDSGHQLWPVASRAAYLLALDAPAARAGAVLVDGAGRFAPGPLPEVAAQGHPWVELAPHIPAGPQAVVTAHERVVRGEDLSDATIDGPPVLELPLRLADWEPTYALAQYRPDTADFPAPDLSHLTWAEAARLPEPREPEPNDEIVEALHDAVRGWADESNGAVTARTARGGAPAAIGATDTGTVQIARLEVADALALLAWAAASGGAHAPRPGAASGRFSAWWVAGAVAGLLDDWPPDPDALGAAVASFEWWTWEHPRAPRPGWSLRLAVTDPARDRSWAVRAHDEA